MQEQNGYLVAPGTEQEKWLEGPDPEMQQRLRAEVEQLRSVVSDNGVSCCCCPCCPCRCPCRCPRHCRRRCRRRCCMDLGLMWAHSCVRSRGSHSC